jgi:hypothetical protein
MTDIVPTTTELQAKHAFEVEQRVHQLVKIIRQAWVELSADLYEFFDQRLWEHLGHDSFDAWLAAPEVEISRRWAYEYINLYRQLVVLQEVPPEDLYQLEPSKLQVVLPAVRRNQVPVKQALADVESLSRSDLRDRYVGQAAISSGVGKAPDITSHLEATHEPDHVRCPTCGQRTTREVIEGSAA